MTPLNSITSIRRYSRKPYKKCEFIEKESRVLDEIKNFFSTFCGLSNIGTQKLSKLII